jgi:high-affinity iron transporter
MIDLLDLRQDSIMTAIRYYFLLVLVFSTQMFACSGEEDVVASIEQEPVEQEPVEQELVEQEPVEQESSKQELPPTMSEQLSATLATFGEADRLQPNPLSEQEGASAKGAEDFDALCVHCHGSSGKGDGPAAQALSVPPGDLTVSEISAGERYQILKNGIPGTAMQGFNAAISDNQTWQLIAFMDSLRPTLKGVEDTPETQETSKPDEAPGATQ